MKDIDQLGVMRNAYGGAHHPRWEYVVLQINIINRVCELDEMKGLGLSSKVTNFLGHNPSGAEILQIWALLFNSGHLPGTFATERAFLKYCKDKKNFRKAIKRGLPKKKREYLNQILEKEDIYSFHKILIGFHLQRYRPKFKKFDIEESTFADFLQEMLDFYIFKQENKDLEEKRNKLKSIFFRIRQLSYLFLDTQYFPFPINFDLTKIFLNLNEYVEVLFKEPENQMIKSMDSFDDLLSINMYHSRESIRELGHHSKEIEKRLELDEKNENLNQVRGIQKYLMEDYDRFQPLNIESCSNGTCFHILFDLQSDLSLKDNFKKNLSFKIEENWNKKYGLKHCKLTFQSSPNPKHLAITLLMFEQSYSRKNIQIIAKLLKDIVSLNYKIKSEISAKKSINVDKAFQIPCKDLILYILKYITSNNLYFEFKDNDDIFILPVRGSKNASDKIKRNLDAMNLDNARRYELNTLREALNEIDHRTELMISLSRILVYDENRQTITDLDGFGIGFKEGKLKILLVEAKNQRSGSISASKRQLKNTLDKIEFKTTLKPKVETLHENKSAYSYITIDN